MSKLFYYILILFEKVGSFYKTVAYSGLVTAKGGVKFFSSSKVINIRGKRSCIKIGVNTLIRGELLTLRHDGEIIIGDYCYIGEGTRIWSGERVLIGNNVLIAHNVNIIDFSHERNSIDRMESYRRLIKFGHPPVKGKIPSSSINIEDDVAIYADSHILMGLTIGKGSVISAGCVITRDVPPYSLMTGNPARRVWKLK